MISTNLDMEFSISDNSVGMPLTHYSTFVSSPDYILEIHDLPDSCARRFMKNKFQRKTPLFSGPQQQLIYNIKMGSKFFGFIL